MSKFIRYPEYFDSMQWIKVRGKADDVAYDTERYWNSSDNFFKSFYADAYAKDNEALNFAIELLEYDRKAIFDTRRILRKMDQHQVPYWSYDEVDIYVQLAYGC